MKISTKQLVTAAMLGAVSIVLGVTNLGMIPVPTAAGKATIMHIPVIIGGILEGPLVGGLVGLIMGIYSFMNPAGAIPADPLVRILPRVLIGVVAYYAYAALKKKNETVAIGLGAALGTLTNTVGFLGMAVLMKYMPFAVAAGTAAVQGIPEVVVAIIITLIVIKPIQRYRKE